MKTLITFAIFSLSVVAFAQDSDVTADQPERPNIVLVLADDLGYGDLNCYGGTELRTPRIDEFAAQGLKLTSCYAAHPNCSPSRAGIMTGRTPFRVGIYNWIPMFSPMHVRRSEITIATLLRNSGYDTCHVGKWHLNGDFNLPTQPQPWDHGFNHWFSTQNNALPNHRNPHNFVRNGTPVGKLDGYSADLVAQEADRWLSEKRDPNKPFFMFVCFHEPHEPIASSPQYTKLYPSDDPSYAAHHGNISQLDAGFGRVLDSLDRLNLRKETLVIFTSDNGPAITSIHPHGSAGPLRDKKGTVYEGGIRVPGIVQWPEHIAPGTVSDEPVSGVDMLPTLCAAAGVETPADRILDGTNVLPVFRGEELHRSRPLYWQFNRAKGDAKVAMRDGDWKLVASLNVPDRKPGGGIPDDEISSLKSAELKDFQLYHLSEDIAETTDVSTSHAARFQSMQKQLQAMYHEVIEAAPRWPTWEWPRYESQKIEWPDYWRKRRAKK